MVSRIFRILGINGFEAENQPKRPKIKAKRTFFAGNGKTLPYLVQPGAFNGSFALLELFF